MSHKSLHFITELRGNYFIGLGVVSCFGIFNGGQRILNKPLVRDPLAFYCVFTHTEGFYRSGLAAS